MPDNPTSHITNAQRSVHAVCYSGRRRRVKVSALRLFCFVFIIILVFVGVAVKHTSLIRMRFGPGHVSRPYASMEEWLARQTLNQLARVWFPVEAYRTFFLFFLFFLLEVMTGFFVFFSLYFKVE